MIPNVSEMTFPLTNGTTFNFQRFLGELMSS